MTTTAYQELMEAPLQSVSNAMSAAELAQVRRASQTLQLFMSPWQLWALITAMGSEEGSWFVAKAVALARMIDEMPVPFQQDRLGEKAVAYLHYFYGRSDWYILERDRDDGVSAAFGFALLNGDLVNAELGYIPITELTELGAELDLYFKPTSLADVRKVVRETYG